MSDQDDAPIDDKPNVIWPQVGHADWCGEWESSDEYQSRSYKRYDRVSADRKFIETFDGNKRLIERHPNPYFEPTSVPLTGGMRHVTNIADDD